ncbi:hypothetical protein KIH41_16745 [Litoribacter ruber]|uniref:Uncharacterized protein n=1 Tax=Litoribacter ruber TaxID=702568 RepID=A0AAP2CJ05_9BACT|nr:MULTISPECIES: hypothetical protein [Litoribacter]MBS9525628.1 hypothetical protein [Litoribacter alkaliphilus]MBT0812938.1 hypothetical protein [Litoribacter ruber]
MGLELIIFFVLLVLAIFIWIGYQKKRKMVDKGRPDEKLNKSSKPFNEADQRRGEADT